MYRHRSLKIALAAAVPALGATGCSDWLTGAKVDDDPNRPTNVTVNLLLNGVQAAQFVNLTGQLARLSAMWSQQFAGSERQFTSLDRYSIGEDELTGEFSTIYAGGGLLDIRRIQDSSRARNDLTYLGIAQVWEALVIGTAASVWGDIPYSQALVPGAPAQLDEQEDVYAGVQAKLDSAIANLRTGTGTGPGTGSASVDLVFRGDRNNWRRAAWSLKARYYMHWAEAWLEGGAFQQQAQVACGGNCITLARQAADSGISSTAGNMTTFQSSNAGEENVWFQFMFRERSGYISAGAAFVNLLKARNDPRLPQLLRSQAGSSDPAAITGSPPGSGAPAAVLSFTRGAANFRQPLITWAETQLLGAEAAYYAGDQVTALSKLNTVRAAVPLPTVALAGPPLLQMIVEEQYIELFQNIEAKNLYERTCHPNLTPARSAGGTTLPFIPGRFFYGVDERNANPNIPAPETEGNTLGGNDNDPRGGTVNPDATGTACVGQNYPDVDG